MAEFSTVNWRETPLVYRFLSSYPSDTFGLFVLEDPVKWEISIYKR